MSPSCGESVLKPGGGGGDAAQTPEVALHPRPHHGPRRLRHHVLPGDQSYSFFAQSARRQRWKNVETVETCLCYFFPWLC